jgi:hypothetical protein
MPPREAAKSFVVLMIPSMPPVSGRLLCCTTIRAQPHQLGKQRLGVRGYLQWHWYPWWGWDYACSLRLGSRNRDWAQECLRIRLRRSIFGDSDAFRIDIDGKAKINGQLDGKVG